MRALVVGLGSVGSRHINNLYDLGVTDLSVFRSRNLPSPVEVKPKNLDVFTDYSEALATGPDVVVIANPTALHLPFAVKAVESGCNVYLEKPVSHNTDGVEGLLAAAARNNVVVAVGCQFRFHPNLVDVKQWIDDGLLGAVASVKAASGEYLPRWHPWEDYRESYAARADLGGGVVLTQIHELDYLYWIFGPVSHVDAEGGRKSSLDIDVEDTALISLKTTAGVSVGLTLDYLTDPPVRRMDVICEKGLIAWDYYTGLATLSEDGNIIKESRVPEGWDRNDLFIALMKDFLESVSGESTPKVPLVEGVEVLKIALAAKESMRGNETVRL